MTVAETSSPILQLEPLYLEKPAAAAYLALSVSTFEDLGRTDESFPKPRLLSARRTGWLVAELRAWGHKRPLSTLPPPPNTGAPKPRPARDESRLSHEGSRLGR